MSLIDAIRNSLAETSSAAELLMGDMVEGVHADEQGGFPTLGVGRVVPAAVLMAIVERPRPTLLLTRRTETLRRHAGQVAFPGGRLDPGDSGPIAAALREAQEEIALEPAMVHVLGTGDHYRTLTGFHVTPVIGVVPPDLPLHPNEAEVARVFEAPLDVLLEPANHIEQAVEWQGHNRHYYEINWDGERIWGATAAMIVNLGRRLAYS